MKSVVSEALPVVDQNDIAEHDRDIPQARAIRRRS
jgi:hypothetical protein